MTDIYEAAAREVSDLLTRYKLRSWLDEKDDDAVVGHTCTASECPIANFIRDETGYNTYVVPEVIEVYHTNFAASYFCPPDFIHHFVERVDNLDPEEFRVPVTAAQARAILDSITTN